MQEAIAKKKSELKAIGEGGFGNSKTIREIHIEDIQDMVFAEASLATLKPRKVGKRIQRKCEPMKLI